MQQLLIKFFTAVLECDSEILDQISAFNGEMYFEQNSMVLLFSLPALYQFLSQNPTKQLHCSYLQFRRQIYHSTVNFELQQMGGLVKIHKSNSHHDLTLYKFHPV